MNDYMHFSRGELSKIYLIQNDKELEADLWQMNPFGCVLKTKEKFQALLGAELALKIFFKENTVRQNVTVTHLGEDNKIGMRWLLDKDLNNKKYTNREKKRLACNSRFPPVISCEDTIYFDNLLLFYVEELSINSLSLTTSKRNLIIPGSKYRTTIFFPGIGYSKVEIEIVHVTDQNNNNYSVGAKVFCSKKSSYVDMVQSYILMFSPEVTYRELIDDGFKSKKAKLPVTIKYIRTQEEFSHCLDLRRKVYAKAYFNDGPVPEEVLTDEDDSNCRIFYGRKHGKIIATGRISYFNGNKSLQEKISKFNPSITSQNTVLFSRCCIDPSYTGSDIFIKIMHLVGIACLNSERRFILLTANKGLARYYSKYKFRKTGIPYKSAGVDLEIMYVDVKKLLLGDGFSPLTWYFLGYPVYTHVYANKSMKVPLRTAPVFYTYMFFRPLLKFILEKLWK